MTKIKISDLRAASDVTQEEISALVEAVEAAHDHAGWLPDHPVSLTEVRWRLEEALKAFDFEDSA